LFNNFNLFLTACPSQENKVLSAAFAARKHVFTAGGSIEIIIIIISLLWISTLLLLFSPVPRFSLLV
jgi:hypothetical protein